jgi:dTDP-4-dehydrorhamnose 3,5-epimerase
MLFSETKLPGVVVIDPELLEDSRGFFTRTFCREEFRAHGLIDHVEQSSMSYNRRRGTVRGMHFQTGPFEETKVVSCVEGRIFDVSIDIRRASPTFGQWFGIELSARNRRLLYLPAGIAHGFQTLVDDSTVCYQMSAPFRSEAAGGIRWDDPGIGIRWPIVDGITISDRDRAWPNWPPVDGS